MTVLSGPPPDVGNSGTALELAGRFEAFAAGLTQAAQLLGHLQPTWQGPAAAQFAYLVAASPQKLAAAADAGRAAATLLAQHGQVLEQANDLIRRASTVGDTELSRALIARAAEIADESARATARALLAAAEQAPRRPGLLHRLWDVVSGWRADVGLGAAQSGEGLIAMALRLGPIRLFLDPLQYGSDVAEVGSDLVSAVRHPVRLAAEVLDLDTWRTNPARAVGHLLPDLLAAVFTGGGSATARGAEIGARLGVSRRIAEAADATRRAAVEEQAKAANGRLIDDALSRARAPGGAELADDWIGEDGTRLASARAAAADALWELNTAAEPEVTRRLTELSHDVGGRLAGLDHRLKERDSLKRKLADKQHQEPSISEFDLLGHAHDTVRYTLVLDDFDYVAGVRRTAAGLEHFGLHPEEIKNRWFSPRYRGLNTSWIDPVTGASFELQFHTPMTWAATETTHGAYEELRLLSPKSARYRELDAAIAAVYAKAHVPPEVDGLNHANLPPPSPPAAIATPPDRTRVAASVGAGTAALLTAADGHGIPADADASHEDNRPGGTERRGPS